MSRNCTVQLSMLSLDCTMKDNVIADKTRSVTNFTLSMAMANMKPRHITSLTWMQRAAYTEPATTGNTHTHNIPSEFIQC